MGRLEAQWDVFARGGSAEPPSLGSVLRVHGPIPDRELLELVVLDASRRWRHGLEARLEHYKGVLPGMAPESEVAAALVRLELEHDPAAGSTSGIEAVRDRVGTLWRLAFEAAADEIAGAKPPSPAGEPSSDEDRFGSYEVQSDLGEGGFGYVYLAVRRTPFRQRVAIKVLKRGMDSQRVLARFEAERQALAQMDHPGIARIYDAGMSSLGLPYIVMEHVRGEPITAYCDRHRLSTRARLDLFRQVCEGVQHAHQRGVIHRDIKPTNVLVSVVFDRPHVKIIDFGVAKAIEAKLSEETIFTEQGQIIGTPEYMSPEQAEMGSLDIDTRADVYSLGVLLYELLTGVRPFDLRKRALLEIQRIIREEDPPRPSTQLSSLGESGTEIARSRATSIAALRGELQRELEWIPLKALRKDRTQRYRTPMDMADDIVNYLAGRPLEAGPESAWYRTRKFARRNRAALAVAGIAVLGGLVAVAGLAWGLNQQSMRRLEVARERDLAEDLLQSTLLIIEDLAPEVGADVGQAAAATETLDRTRDRLAQSPVSGAFRVGIHRAIGEAYLRLGRLPEAERELRSAIALGGSGETRYHVALADMLLAQCLMRQDCAGEAGLARDRALAALGDLGSASRELRLQIHSQSAGITKRQGQVLSSDDPAREPLLRDARRQYQALVDEYAESGESQSLGALVAEYDLALVDSLLGDQDAAIERLGRVRAEYAARFGRNFSSWVNTTAELGLAVGIKGGQERKAGRAAEAQRLFEQAEALYLEAIDEGEVTIGGGHRRVRQTIERLGNLYLATQRPEDAEAAFEEAFTRHRVVEGPFGARANYCVRRRSLALIQAGRANEAVAAITGHFVDAEQSGRVSQTALAGICDNVIEILDRVHRPAQAEQWRAKSNTLRDADSPTDP